MEKVVNDRYHLHSIIRTDDRGTRYLALDERESGVRVALEWMDKVKAVGDINSITNSMNYSLQTLTNLHHSNLISIYDWGITDERVPYYCTIWPDGKFLVGEEISLSPKMIHAILFQLCHAMDYLHSRGIVHGNLNPSNLILNNRQVRISGYAATLLLQGDEQIIKHLSREYTSPDVFKKNVIDHHSDLYSLGAIAFFLFTGHPPKKDSERTKENQDMLIQPIKGRFFSPYPWKKKMPHPYGSIFL